MRRGKERCGGLARTSLISGALARLQLPEMLVLLLLSCASDPDGDGVIAGDCAPNDGAIFPGAHEFCNGVDDDCDDAVDETFDLDEDTFLADEADCRALGLPTDCDEGNAAVHPGAVETCDGTDEDCSGVIDDTVDADADGFFACEDCDDDDAFVNAAAPEACDGIDNDCSGGADEPWDDDGDGASECADDCDDADPLRSPDLPESCDGVDNNCDGAVDEGFDADADGQFTCRGDCDDRDPAVYSGAEEACDGVDNDCDDTTLEDADVDADGYSLCDGDCADENAAALPGGVEVCDGADNDCNGATDELATCFGCVDAPPYIVCLSGVAWGSASDACHTFGADLVVIVDAAENATVANLVASYTSEAAWIGYTDGTTEGTFEWVDGSGTGYSSWAGGEPNDSGGEDCAATNWSSVLYWNDYGCSAVLPFVCE